MKADEIKDRIAEIRARSILANEAQKRDQEINLLLVEAILELNQTLVYIKENTKNLRWID